MNSQQILNSNETARCLTILDYLAYRWANKWKWPSLGRNAVVQPDGGWQSIEAHDVELRQRDRATKCSIFHVPFCVQSYCKSNF